MASRLLSYAKSGAYRKCNYDLPQQKVIFCESKLLKKRKHRKEPSNLYLLECLTWFNFISKF